MELTKRIRNLTVVEQSVFIQGRRVVLGPTEEKDFTPDVADMFVQQCDGLVEEVVLPAEIGAVYEDTSDYGFVWIANFTGDPDASPTVPHRKKVGRGQYETVQVPNPKAEAMDVVRYLDGGMREYEAQDGVRAENLGPTEIKVPKYGRKQFAKHIANWCLNRDANSRWISPFHSGRIKISRAKSSFEPDKNWELDDMRCYLFMMDRKAVLGPSEKQVRAEVGEQSDDDAVREAKELCMKRLHFRLADPQYRLYSKAEFEEFRRDFEKAQKPVISSKPGTSASASL